MKKILILLMISILCVTSCGFPTDKLEIRLDSYLSNLAIKNKEIIT